MADRDGGRLGYLLTRAAQLWRGEVARALRLHDVTSAQYFVLMTVFRRAKSPDKSPLTQRHVVDRTGIDANTASAVIRSLTQRGLIRRDPHPDDARAHALTLTEHGQEIARACAGLVREVNARFFGVVDESQLASLLHAVVDHAEGN